MRTLLKVTAMQRLAAQWQRSGCRVVLVPTMGSLHEGHRSLIRRARRKAGADGIVVVSIYVNPTQFGVNEDFDAYPRDLRRDLTACRAEGVDVVFAPSDADMYPFGNSTHVQEEALSILMEGASRPTHFRGVTTVVAKLFNLVRPDWAVFGAKDWQQAAVIRRMVRDLNQPVKIDIAPTVRESDGLAMSSRNVNLTPDERVQAGVLHRALKRAREEVRVRRAVTPAALRAVVLQCFQSAPAARLDYVEFFDPGSLQPVRKVTPGMHMALAVRFSRTRLIDNGRL